MEGNAKRIDHIGIAVYSIEKALPFYEDVLQLKLLAIEEVDSQGVRVAFLEIGQSKIELLEPLSEKSPIFSFLKKKGEGIHHIAVGVSNIDARIEELKAKGVQMVHDKAVEGAGGAHIAFIHPKSANGALVEFCEKK
ncbi:methylmalonyl-CoA epimerase [Bacillus alkalicellulosilyticus]|uniref:methylmalonyl-CoA epimerase n=1 Tax=Alkalihalobacterium alkalicellulosilyticum TaxID=1912214 RepID=UPI000997513A|nr:methylmalonyl-CoA epimerase [Bacillus alkalicellulosilyticus]